MLCTPPFSIRAPQYDDFQGMHDALDIVAKERSYLALMEAPSLDESYAFYQRIRQMDYCQYIAVDSAQDVLGWCDIVPFRMRVPTAHVGVLGIGLIPQARGLGLGTLLLDTTLQKARAKGLTRIELTVRSDNQRAINLYEQFGFVIEGLKRHDLRMDGVYFDSYLMALTTD